MALHMPVFGAELSSVWSARNLPLSVRTVLLAGGGTTVVAVSWPAGVPSHQSSALWQCQSSDGRSASFEFNVASKKLSNFHVLRRRSKDAEDHGGSGRGGTGHPWRLPRMQWGVPFEEGSWRVFFRQSFPLACETVACNTLSGCVLLRAALRFRESESLRSVPTGPCLENATPRPR